MFDKKKLPIMASKLIKITGQQVNAPAFSSLGFRQGSQNLAPIPQGVKRSDNHTGRK